MRRLRGHDGDLAGLKDGPDVHWQRTGLGAVLESRIGQGRQTRIGSGRLVGRQHVDGHTDVFDMWDNSGVVRPDMEGKGHTDRGDSRLSNALLPTKVKGQMGPGGQMPSITLKGVSIKGASSVEYEEAVATAQSEAQSALSQERVPRAYQGAVRGYFDDL